jgi:hypothetical protein
MYMSLTFPRSSFHFHSTTCRPSGPSSSLHHIGCMCLAVAGEKIEVVSTVVPLAPADGRALVALFGVGSEHGARFLCWAS